jgi:Mg-chelatase subunit ChlI
VQEAAHLLGISPEAVRSRLYRGTLDKETGTDGTVYVRLHADQLRRDDDQTVDQSQPNAEFVGELRARVEDLREQLAEEREARRRADTIIAQLARANEEQARTIRELEVPPESSPDERESPETVEEEPERAEPHPDRVESEEPAQRPWWRRVLGGR